MDFEILKTFGQYAGIGGLALAAFLLLSRGIIQKQLLTIIGKSQAYRLMTLATVLGWSLALAGVGAWVFVEVREKDTHAAGPSTPVNTSSSTPADCSIKVEQGIAACGDARVGEFKIER